MAQLGPTLTSRGPCTPRARALNTRRHRPAKQRSIRAHVRTRAACTGWCRVSIYVPCPPPFPALSAACVQAATSKDASKDAASASNEPEPVFEDLEARVFYEALPDVRSLVPAVLLGDVEPVAPVAPAAAAEVGQRTASPVTCHAHNRC